MIDIVEWARAFVSMSDDYDKDQKYYKKYGPKICVNRSRRSYTLKTEKT